MRLFKKKECKYHKWVFVGYNDDEEMVAIYMCSCGAREERESVRAKLMKK